MPDSSTEQKSKIESALEASAFDYFKTRRDEIPRLIRLRGDILRMLALARTDCGRHLIGLQLEAVNQRIRVVENVVYAVSRIYFVQIQTGLRNEKYPPVKGVQKSVIRFADE